MAADPGGVFQSNEHRHVLGHLRTPEHPLPDYTDEQLFDRMGPDVDTDFCHVEELREILLDLEASGYCRHTRMTERGLAALSGPIANEPPPGTKPQSPASVAGRSGN